MAPRVIAFALGIALAGCFSEEPSAGSCAAGTPGCSCAAGSCDPGYDCAPEVDLCVPTGCNPGSRDCTCAEDQCLGALVCKGGVCGDDDTGGTVATTAGDPASTTGTSATADGDDASASTDPASTTDAPSDSSGPPADARCLTCFMEKNAGACMAMFDVCAVNTACKLLADCVTDCLAAHDAQCIQGCCAANPGGDTEWANLVTCMADACQAECLDLPLSCGGG